MNQISLYIVPQTHVQRVNYLNHTGLRWLTFIALMTWLKLRTTDWMVDRPDDNR